MIDIGLFFDLYVAHRSAGSLQQVFWVIETDRIPELQINMVFVRNEGAYILCMMICQVSPLETGLELRCGMDNQTIK